MIISSQMQENIPVAGTREETDENVFDDLLLTDSQERFLLSESNLNIQSSSSPTTQNSTFMDQLFLTTSDLYFSASLLELR